MTISVAPAKSGPYPLSGIATVFPYGFRILSASHLQVVTATAAGVETVVDPVNYTVSGVGDAVGGSISYPTVPVTGSLVMIRNVPLDQPVDLSNQSDFHPETLEMGLDRLGMQIQQLDEKVDRSVVVQVTSSTSPEDLIDDLVTASSTAVTAAGTATTAAGVAVAAAAAASSTILIGDFPSATGTWVSGNTLTLSRNPGSANAVLLFENDQHMIPGLDYTVSGTTLTRTVTPTPGVEWAWTIVSASLMAVPQATEISVGGAEIATAAETAALTDLTRVVPPGRIPDAIASYGPFAGERNRIINGEGRIAQWGAGSFPATRNDKLYLFDRWYGTTSNAGTVTWNQATLLANGSPTGMNFKHNTASPAQKVAIAQIIEADWSQDLRGGTVSFQFKALSTGVNNLRWAILSYSGAADAGCPLTFINNWASTTYTPGNFFVAASFAVVSSGQAVLSTSLQSFTAENLSVPANVNNLYVVFWSEADVVNTVTFTVTDIQLEPGRKCTAYIRRNRATEELLAYRFYEAVAVGASISSSTRSNTTYTTSCEVMISHRANKRVVPAATATFTNQGVGSANSTVEYTRLNGVATASASVSDVRINAELGI